MILNNFGKLLAYVSGNSATYCTPMTGTVTALSFSSSNIVNVYIPWTSTSSYGYGIDIGFGDTAPTGDDYKLEDSNYQDNNSLLTFISGVNSYIEGGIKSSTAVFQNNTSDPVTVKEVGLYVKPGNQTSAGPTQRVLIVREVLDTPITMQPGEARAFTVNLTFTAN